MEKYNLKKLIAELKEHSHVIKGQDIIQVAADERIATTTVREYLKGNVTVPALGKAILERCKAISIAKKAA